MPFPMRDRCGWGGSRNSDFRHVQSWELSVRVDAENALIYLSPMMRVATAEVAHSSTSSGVDMLIYVGCLKQLAVIAKARGKHAAELVQLSLLERLAPPAPRGGRPGAHAVKCGHAPKECTFMANLADSAAALQARFEARNTGQLSLLSIAQELVRLINQGLDAEGAYAALISRFSH